MYSQALSGQGMTCANIWAAQTRTQAWLPKAITRHLLPPCHGHSKWQIPDEG